MPLRGLFYFAQQYDKIVKREDLDIYGTEITRLPTPKYVVFYNGLTKKEDIITFRLSDSFDNKEDAAIEVIAKCYNINYGHNREILEACKPLMEYSIFVKAVRENTRSMKNKSNASNAEAINAAIDWCIEQNVLRDFLSQSRGEVIDLFINELYSMENAVRVAKKKLEKQLQDTIEQLEEERRKAEEANKKAEEADKKVEEERRIAEEKLKQVANDSVQIQSIEVICNNLKKGTDVSMIASFLGLDEDYILKIKKLLDENPQSDATDIFNMIRE